VGIVNSTLVWYTAGEWPHSRPFGVGAGVGSYFGFIVYHSSFR